MTEPKISKNFTIEDIRALRIYNSERHLKMTRSEIFSERKASTKEFLALMNANKCESSKQVSPISFDEDCPETTPGIAVKFKRANPPREKMVL